MSLDSKIARACYIRDGWKCRHCRNRSGLHPHHVVYKSQQGPDELWNLITLCNSCHIEGVHGGKLIVAYDRETWATVRDNQVRFMRKDGWKPS